MNRQEEVSCYTTKGECSVEHKQVFDGDGQYTWEGNDKDGTETIHVKDYAELFIGGRCNAAVIVQNDATVHIQTLSRISVRVHDYGDVFIYGHAQVTVSDSATVYVYGTGHVEASDASMVHVSGQVSVNARDRATIHAYGGSQVTVADNATAYAHDWVRAIAGDDAVVHASDSADVIATDNSQVHTPRGFQGTVSRVPHSKQQQEATSPTAGVRPYAFC